MPVPLTVNDFSLIRAACELRYENAYLIYDRTGQIANALGKRFESFEVVTATPNQSAFRSTEGSLTLELAKAFITSDRPQPETFAASCKKFFSVITDFLEVQVLTRIGFRQTYSSPRKDQRSAVEALNEIPVVGRIPTIGRSPEPLAEITLRWEGENTGTTVRLLSQSGKMNLILPPEFTDDDRELKKEFSGLMLDVDYYTVAPVEVAQWDAVAWIPDAARSMRKQLNSLLEG